ncbi:glycerol-3-phosphate acyltransferase [Litorilinea aerophila]|uniref:Glycerol-3-phosphate acyltransferase n=1 Tax=Litorilinea aerophila TaxID=1204385 RepID=A0A540VF63_9CHLR|nr:glycerol-3-phosphate acyltransferase [Litorilinea aerophila]MCC9077456.1 glycerol-3-phosphate acyltransferase [Litorilinea aerophila]GIV77576.1 MAG: acyl-phosphate glycerol 3-phosphate acyltransferase [Litorilinea sp.]
MLKTVLVVAASYLLGCFCTAYYLVRWRMGQDIRTLGSGNAGAKNAGRILGPAGFVAVFLGDVAKGSLAVGLALWQGLAPWGVVLAYLAVVLGHLYPVQLGFRGGKGVAAGFGGLLVLDPVLAAGVVVAAGLAFLLTRSFTLSGLVAIGLAPFIGLVLNSTASQVVAVALISALLLYAHRTNMAEMIRQRAARAEDATHQDRARG